MYCGYVDLLSEVCKKVTHTHCCSKCSFGCLLVSNNIKMDILMLKLMCGIPGSGKSTYAKGLARASSATILEPDAFHLHLTGKFFHGPACDMIWATVKTTAAVLLKSDQTVIIDATALNKHRRSEWVHIARACEVPCSAWALVTSKDLCIRRNLSRERVVPEGTLNSQMARYQLPTLDEGFSSIHYVSTDGDSFVVVGSADQNQMSGSFEALTGTFPYKEQDNG